MEWKTPDTWLDERGGVVQSGGYNGRLETCAELIVGRAAGSVTTRASIYHDVELDGNNYQLCLSRTDG